MYMCVSFSLLLLLLESFNSSSITQIHHRYTSHLNFDMEMGLGIATHDLLLGSCNNNNTNDVDVDADADADASHIAKGKRTKRLRHLSPCAVTAAAISSSSSASEEHAGSASFSSTTTFESTDQEEEDMANCLILLAQGKRGGKEDNSYKMREKSSSSTNNNNSRRFSEPSTATAAATAKVGFYIYECKTCNRTFPSFQALGGHRASHKKPKVSTEEKKPQPPSLLPIVGNCEFEETKQGDVMSSPPRISLQLGCGGSNNNSNRGFHGGMNKSKVHECSICGSEFTSGQALGGHMRRHRASTSTSSAHHHVVDIDTSCDNNNNNNHHKPRNVLELDLNLPAPADNDHHLQGDSKFRMVLSAAPTLVGCHY